MEIELKDFKQNKFKNEAKIKITTQSSEKRNNEVKGLKS